MRLYVPILQLQQQLADLLVCDALAGVERKAKLFVLGADAVGPVHVRLVIMQAIMHT